MLQRRLFRLLILASAVSFPFVFQQNVYSLEKTQYKLVKETIPIKDMGCEGCATKVAMEVYQLKGIFQITISESSTSLEVTYYSNLTPRSEIEAAIERARLKFNEKETPGRSSPAKSSKSK